MGESLVTRQRTIVVGRVFFGVGLIGLGAQHFYFRQFVPMVVPIWPAWIPGRLPWVLLVGALLVVCGAAIASGIRGRAAALTTGVVFLLSFLLLHIPANIAARVSSLGGWTIALKAFAFAGCSLVVAESFLSQAAASSRARLTLLGVIPFSVMLIAFGCDHFLYAPFVAALVPVWIPGHLFWTWFAGAALIAAGLGMLVPLTARLAARLLGAMLFLWVLMLHIPRAIADPTGLIGNEVTSVFQALALSGVAFILSETLTAKHKTIPE
jgi:uncharacterized membrane protein